MHKLLEIRIQVYHTVQTLIYLIQSLTVLLESFEGLSVRTIRVYSYNVYLKCYVDIMLVSQPQYTT